ncbi:hypothetical protein [Amycolatopsis sp. cmx-4-68]|uniref:hypothetical protein n=1 Tax=Amycolatopsis sp. cmx-4-68 TaxID=2790938 RepID=UPI00397DCC5E
MQHFRTGDPEPGPAVQVLAHHIREGSEAAYLARFQHGWRWVNSKTELDRRDKTPLTWHFAMTAQPDTPDGKPTHVRTMSNSEHIGWLTS